MLGLNGSTQKKLGLKWSTQHFKSPKIWYMCIKKTLNGLQKDLEIEKQLKVSVIVWCSHSRMTAWIWSYGWPPRPSPAPISRTLVLIASTIFHNHAFIQPGHLRIYRIIWYQTINSGALLQSWVCGSGPSQSWCFPFLFLFGLVLWLEINCRFNPKNYGWKLGINVRTYVTALAHWSIIIEERRPCMQRYNLMDRTDELTE